VSEASEKIKIKILNKQPGLESCRVRVATIDAEAKAGEDYEEFDKIIEFRKGEAEQNIEVLIKDDDNWEPDEDFFVQLYDAENINEKLLGSDTRCRVTIIDDDKPGQISFKESKTIKVLGNETNAEVEVIRKNGADGLVTVDYETFEIDKSNHTASADVDFKHTKGTLKFA